MERATEDASDVTWDYNYDDFSPAKKTDPKTAEWNFDDATWVLAATFIIFTMQTGFAMLESGAVSLKNETNIMMKNIVGVLFGGLSYWSYGYGLSFGDSDSSNSVIAFGTWFADPTDQTMGSTLTRLLFQLSFACTATTIVSGAMAERCNFSAYCAFCMVNMLVYTIPAHWLWSSEGMIKKLGAVDMAGSGGIHLVGGTAAFVAAWMLGPRLGRWDLDIPPPMGKPANSLAGLFVLWWGWLGFNAGSTYGLTENRWRLAAKAACTTMTSSFGGGMTALVVSYIAFKGKTDVLTFINGTLGSLVAITAGCTVVTLAESFLIGCVGGLLAIAADPLLVWLRVDDAVGATCVHAFGGAWGMIAVGIFAAKDHFNGEFCAHDGLIHGGGPYLLGVQLLVVVANITWSATVTTTLLFLINKFLPIRMSEHEELLGADFTEHDIRVSGVGVSRAVSVLRNYELDYDGIDLDLERRQDVGETLKELSREGVHFV